MYRPRPQVPRMGWGFQRPPHPHNNHWRHPGGPRSPYHGQRQRFQQPRLPMQSGNDNYWCETCDRGFPTEDILIKHKQQHQKCNIDGCQFIAHPKVITKHIQMQHSTGLYKKIANLKNPEEIEKWREERRKRYPTKSNIDKKAAELKEKIDRGEKMGLERKRNHHHKVNHSDQDSKLGGKGIKRSNMRNENHQRTKIRRNNPTDDNHNKKPKLVKPKKQITTATEDYKLKPFAGILSLQMESDNELETDTSELNNLIEDDDFEAIKDVETGNSSSKTEPIVCGALSSLMCEYGSSDEEENSEKKTESLQSKLISKNAENNCSQKNEHDLHTNISIDVTKCMSGITNVLNVAIDTEINKESIDSVEGNKTVSIINDQNVEVESRTHTSKNQVINTNECNRNPDTDSLTGKDEKSIRLAEVCESNEFRDSIQETKPNEESDSGPEEVKVEIRKQDNSPSISQEYKHKNVRKGSIRGRVQIQRKWSKLPSTLLQKLLAKEMQQERNIVLQCIRHIRRNNYFDQK